MTEEAFGEQVELLGLACPRGARAQGVCVVGELPDGSPIELAVRIVHGAHEGPVATMTGMIHGDEPNGMVAVNRVCDAVAPADLRGTIVAFPAADPLALITRSRVSDLDHEHLGVGRAWPGDPSGPITERLAAVLFEGLRRSRAHLDFGDGGRDFVARELLARAPAGDGGPARLDLDLATAFAMGLPIAVQPAAASGSPEPAGAAALRALPARVPGLAVRLGGAGRVWPGLVDEAVAGTLNVLRHLGMLAGERVEAGGAPVVGAGGRWPRASRGGWWEQRAALGDVVEAGQRIGRVRDVFGEVVEEIAAPARGIVSEVRNTSAIMTGECVGHAVELA